MKTSTNLRSLALGLFAVFALTQVSSATSSEADAQRKLQEVYSAIQLSPGSSHQDNLDQIKYFQDRTRELSDIQYALGMTNPGAENVTLPVVKKKCTK